MAASLHEGDTHGGKVGGVEGTFFGGGEDELDGSKRGSFLDERQQVEGEADAGVVG